MSSDSPVSDDDIAAFRASVGPVRRVFTDKVAPQAPKPAPSPEQARLDSARVMAELAEGHFDPAEFQPGDMLSFARAGLHKATLRKLRRGHYRVAAEIDLHGLSAPAAKLELGVFLQEALAQGLRCVRIIHGKGYRSGNGGPVIKPRVARWLRRHDAVLAFCSARPVDGGTGAVYVLLRRA